MPEVTGGGEWDATSSDVGEAERDASDEPLGLQRAFGGEQAHARLLSLHHGLVVEVAASGGEITGCKKAELVAIGALERHFYVLPARAAKNGVIAQACDKDFFVSPFLEMGLRYEFRVRPPGEKPVVAMTLLRGEEIALTASFAGERRDLTDSNLLRAWLGNPLMTLKVIAGIHWEAARTWLKGVRYLGRAPRTAGTGPVQTRKTAA